MTKDKGIMQPELKMQIKEKARQIRILQKQIRKKLQDIQEIIKKREKR